MNTITLFRIAAIGSIAIVAGALGPVAWGAGQAPQARQDLERELALCNSGRSGQDTATCLKEIRAAQQEAGRGGLGTSGDARLSTNATNRCAALPESDKAACIERITAPGSMDGSVQGGGILRRSEQTVPQ